MVKIQSSNSIPWRLMGLTKARKRSMTLCLFFLTTLCATLAMGQPPLTGQIKSFRLLGYSSGMRPSQFSGQTTDGKKVSLAQFQGQVVLVNFFATWCTDCRPEMPMFEKLHVEFASKGLTVLGINVREGTSAITRYAKELGLTFPLVLDPYGKISRSYGVIGLPTTFLIGRDGRPVALAIGPRKWESEKAKTIIRTLLAESFSR